MGIHWDNFAVDSRRVYFRKHERRTDGHPEGVRRYHRLMGFFLRIFRIARKEVINDHIYYLNKKSLLAWMNQQNLATEYKSCSFLESCLINIFNNELRLERKKDKPVLIKPDPVAQWRTQLFKKFPSTMEFLNEMQDWDRFSVSELHNQAVFIFGNPEEKQVFNEPGKTLIMKLSAERDGKTHTEPKEGYVQLNVHLPDVKQFSHMDEVDTDPRFFQPHFEALDTVLNKAKAEGFANVQVEGLYRKEWLDTLDPELQESWIANSQFIFLEVVSQNAFTAGSCIKEVLYVMPTRTNL